MPASQIDFSHSNCFINTHNGTEPIMAVYRMKGHKVALSLGVLANGNVVFIDKNTGEKILHLSVTDKAREIRKEIEKEYQDQKIPIPPYFKKALSL